MDVSAVRHAYRRWAPVYDFTFGQIAEAGRKHAVKIINSRKGRVLDSIGPSFPIGVFYRYDALLASKPRRFLMCIV
jgi:hypothetical protein